MTTTEERLLHKVSRIDGAVTGALSEKRIEQVTTQALGTITVPQAASLLGVSKSAAYRAIEARLAGDLGAWPTNVIRVGRTLRIPTAEIRVVLGLDSAA